MNLQHNFTFLCHYTLKVHAALQKIVTFIINWLYIQEGKGS